jgi:hypothetical protein
MAAVVAGATADRAVTGRPVAADVAAELDGRA